MSTLKNEVHPCAQSVHFTPTELVVDLTDGRRVSVPLAWFASLSKANSEQLHDFQIMGDGEGIHWPQLNEDISVKGLLLGTH